MEKYRICLHVWEVGKGFTEYLGIHEFETIETDSITIPYRNYDTDGTSYLIDTNFRINKKTLINKIFSCNKSNCDCYKADAKRINSKK